MVFLYKWYKSPGSINLTALSNVMQLVSLYTPWKHQETSAFQGIGKETTGMEWETSGNFCFSRNREETTGMEWVNPLTHSH